MRFLAAFHLCAGTATSISEFARRTQVENFDAAGHGGFVRHWLRLFDVHHPDSRRCDSLGKRCHRGVTTCMRDLHKIDARLIWPSRLHFFMSGIAPLTFRGFQQCRAWFGPECERAADVRCRGHDVRR